MVYYYKSRCGEYTIYAGKDKYEDEDLIKYGLPEDVWFQVDDLSSAHIYLRQKKGEKLDDISPELLLDCGSLVKANSIAGCKVRSIYYDLGDISFVGCIRKEIETFGQRHSNLIILLDTFTRPR